jgi:hypothetical protein
MIEELWEMVFSVTSDLRLYSEHERGKFISWGNELVVSSEMVSESFKFLFASDWLFS